MCLIILTCLQSALNDLEMVKVIVVQKCFFFWASCWNHCLATVDLGAGAEQPFNCRIVQNRQAMHCSPWGAQWIGHWRATWLTVCSSAPYSQAAREAISHLYKQEQKRLTPLRRRLSWSQALLGRVILRGGCQCRGWKCRVLWGCPFTPHSIGNPPTAPHVRCCQIN